MSEANEANHAEIGKRHTCGWNSPEKVDTAR
jgi:hypothetical protein